MRASPRPEAVAVLAEGRIDQRLQHLQQGLLDQPVHHGRESPAPASRRPAWGCPPGAPDWAGSVPSSKPCRMSGHWVFRYSPGLLHRASIDAGASLVGFDAFPRRRHVVLCQRLPEQVRWPPVRLLMPRRSCFIALGFRRASPAPVRRRPACRRLLMHCTSKRHVSSLSFSFGPSPGSTPPQLLRPLLTSRSGSSPSPFQAQGEISPGKNASFTAQPPHLRHLALTTRASQSLACSPCSAAPQMRFVFLDSRFTLHASSPRSVTLTQLRFTSLAVVSSREDFHLQESRPCWAHIKKARSAGASIGSRGRVRRSCTSTVWRLRGPLTCVAHFAVDEREQRVVAGRRRRSAPAWNLVPRWRTMIEPARIDLAAEDLDAEHLGLRVAAVARSSRRLFLCHVKTP